MNEESQSIQDQITALYVHLAGAYAKQADIRVEIDQLHGMVNRVQKDIDGLRNQIHAKEEVLQAMKQKDAQPDEGKKKSPAPSETQGEPEANPGVVKIGQGE